MNRSLLKAFFLGLLLMMTATTKAQRRSEVMPQPKVLAEMMLQEKKSGRLDDAPYIAYLVDSLGYTMKIDSTMMRQNQEYYQRAVKRSYVGKVFTKSSDNNFAVQVELRSQDRDDGRLLRSIEIQPTDHTMIWWVVVELKKFGLKQTEGDGDFMDLKGKGLFAGTGLKSISIGCWFDKNNKGGSPLSQRGKNVC